MEKKVGIFVPVTLGMLTAFGPFVTDFYLPVLPEMAGYFNTSPALASMSLTAGIAGLAMGQMLIGPLTDKYGRKHILVMSMMLFAVASVLCIFAPNIFLFNLMRVFQGLSGAGGMVISKSMATDMYSGHELARFMAILGAINGVAPVCAPVIGGSVAGIASWQGVFALLLAIGVVLMVCSMLLGETLPAERRMRKSVVGVYANLFRVFRNPLFLFSTLMNIFFCFTFFAYISSSPFILQDLYGLSPFAFSLCFGVNAVMIIVGAGLATRFRSETAAMKCGAAGYLVAALLVAFCLLADMPLVVLMLSYVCLTTSFGLMQPPTTAVALDSERANAGAASAMFGASGFMSGALSSPLVGIGDVSVASGVVMVSGAVACLVVCLSLCRKIVASRTAR